MVVTEIYKGQGLGNQLWCYVVTRVIAKEKGYDFGIKNPKNFKCLDFMDLDFGKDVVGGTGPEGGPPETLPEGIKYYYLEKRTNHPKTGEDIRDHDRHLMNVLNETKIDGIMQDEQYIIKHKEDVCKWLTVKKEFECFDYASDDICVINFRGGEFMGVKNLFLPQKYWDYAVREMKKINPKFTFVVITEDVKTAKKFFPDFDVFHFSVSKDYAVIKNAHYLIMSNSTFAWFPAWTSKTLKFAIAPKYWASYNVSDGYWSCGYNLTSGWSYLDREGKIFTYEECLEELKKYMENFPKGLYLAPPIYEKRLWFVKRNIERKTKKLFKIIISKLK